MHNARSAGTSNKARIKVTHKLITWADVIFVMEGKHRQILKQLFPENINGKPIVVLDIEDNYRFNDTELIAILQASLYNYL